VVAVLLHGQSDWPRFIVKSQYSSFLVVIKSTLPGWERVKMKVCSLSKDAFSSHNLAKIGRTRQARRCAAPSKAVAELNDANTSRLASRKASFAAEYFPNRHLTFASSSSLVGGLNQKLDPRHNSYLYEFAAMDGKIVVSDGRSSA
jgi:hypothetical protein